jgi:hypothetical protein
MTAEESASSSVALQQATETTPASGTAGAGHRTRGLLAAQVLWALVVILSLVVFGAKVMTLYRVLEHPSPVAQAALRQLGISPAFRTAFYLSFETLSALVFFIVAGALARFRRDHLPALLASTTFFAFGAAGATLDLLVAVDTRWIVPVALLGYIYRTTFLWFLYVFPDGRFVPPWTRWLAACWAVVFLFIAMPPSVPASISHWPPLAGIPMQLVLVGSVIYTQVYRYRRVSDTRQREQTRWVVYGVAVALVLSSLAELFRMVTPASAQPGGADLLHEFIFLAVWDLSLVVIPVTVGIAILRRRLYDIDIIINRTLVYGLLTAILAGLFAGVVSLSQKLFVVLTGQTSDLATVLATLCIVAAFTPVKNRLQNAVDKRFKETSDAIPHLKAFGEQVRLRIAPVDARQVTCRLLDEAVAAFDAQGGAAYLDQDGQPQLIHTAGEWSGVAVLDVPLQAGDKRVGALSLGERRDRRSYSAREREALEQVAQTVATAIEQDSR